MEPTSPAITTPSNVSQNEMRTARDIELLARPGLSAVAKDPIRSNTNSPTGSLATGLNYMRLAVQELCATALGSARSLAELTKSELDFEAATKALQQQGSLLQEKDKLIAARDSLITQKDEALKEALGIVKRVETALEEKETELSKSASNSPRSPSNSAAKAC